MKWLNAEKTILQVQVADGHCRIVEPESADWADLSQRPDIAPFVPPSEAEQNAVQMMAVRAARAEAYRLEADPLFFKLQRGEAQQQDWLDAIDQIRTRYSYPHA